MRLAIALALVSTGLFFQTTAADEPAILPAPAIQVASAPATSPEVLPSPVAKQFVIKCEIYAQDAKAKSRVVAVPHIVVTDGQEGHIAIESQTPFVTGVQPGNDDARKPVITVLREGTTGTVTVKSLAGDQVHLDASFSESNVRSVDKVEASAKGEPTSQAPLLTTESWRIVRSVKLGESVDVMDTAGGKLRKVATLMVDQLGADEAAITPIGAAEPTETEAEPKPLFPVVYSVGDLLEQNAQKLPTEKLQHTDFVLVMDMIISQAGVEWNDDTEMHCLPDKRALVITHTQEGHEAIADFLSDKRTHVAEVRELLLR